MNGPVDSASARSDLMSRLHALDAALAACQRKAIAVDELCRVWDSHSAGLEGLGGTQSQGEHRHGAAHRHVSAGVSPDPRGRRVGNA